jgi:hypothetical protein
MSEWTEIDIVWTRLRCENRRARDVNGPLNRLAQNGRRATGEPFDFLDEVWLIRVAQLRGEDCHVRELPAPQEPHRLLEAENPKVLMWCKTNGSFESALELAFGYPEAGPDARDANSTHFLSQDT